MIPQGAVRPGDGKVRVGIVLPELGIPSEVWILRQCAEFRHIHPVLLTWRLHPGFQPGGLEVRLIPGAFDPPRTLARRVATRLGLSVAARPPSWLRRNIAAAVAAAEVEALFCHFAWTGLAVSNSVDPDVPVVWQVHGRDVSTHMRDRSYRRAVAEALPGLRHIAAVGHFQIETLKGLGLSCPASVIPCGAPLSLFAATKAPSRAPGRPLRFIAVSRLSQEKGVLQTLDAFERASATRDDLEMVFVGDGPVREELQARATASPYAARIHLLGSLPSERVAEELALAHVFVQHSREVGGWIEGFGVSLTEAGARGLPLLASRTGGIVDQVEHGANGLLFGPGDVTAQAAFMVQLAQDEALRRRLGETARELAARFDSAQMTSKLEAVLLRAAGRA
jgi:glycosyltransferase involved in cell wall biosynthesis